MPSSSGDAAPPAGEEEHRPCFFRFIVAISRIVAVGVVIGLWCLVGLLLDEEEWQTLQAFYIIAMGVIVTIFELIWILDKCFSILRQDSCICACWRLLVWTDNWKRFFLYTLIAVPCFIEPISTMETLIAGSLVIFLGFLYLLRSCQGCRCVRRRKSTAHADDDSTSLVSRDDSSARAADYDAPVRDYVAMP